jgi:DNA-directed RNA polymerase specialized sigma subunit
MARKCRDQLTLLVPMGYAEEKLRAEPLLEKPLSPEERRKIDRLYRENQRLVWKCQHEMALLFPSIGREQINSCVDVGFLKAARVHDAEKGKLSTRFYVDARGECTHWLRAHGYGVSAPGKVRELGGKLRQLMGQGLTTEQALREVNALRKHPATMAEAKDALVATAGIAHEVNNWEAHYCPRPQPWEVLEAT